MPLVANSHAVSTLDYVFASLSVLIAAISGPWFARMWLRERREAREEAEREARAGAQAPSEQVRRA